MRVGNEKKPGAAQCRDGARNGFDGEAKMVGNILAAHRHRHPVAVHHIQPVGKAQQEGGDPLLRFWQLTTKRCCWADCKFCDM